MSPREAYANRFNRLAIWYALAALLWAVLRGAP